MAAAAICQRRAPPYLIRPPRCFFWRVIPRLAAVHPTVEPQQPALSSEAPGIRAPVKTPRSPPLTHCTPGRWGDVVGAGLPAKICTTRPAELAQPARRAASFLAKTPWSCGRGAWRFCMVGFVSSMFEPPKTRWRWVQNPNVRPFRKVPRNMQLQPTPAAAGGGTGEIDASATSPYFPDVCLRSALSRLRALKNTDSSQLVPTMRRRLGIERLVVKPGPTARPSKTIA